MAEEKEGYKIGGYRISDIYQGGYSTLAPPLESYVTAGSLGMTTDPRSANIIQEVSTKLSSGVKQIEIEGVSPEVFDSIPRQYFKEVNRMTKLTGINVSLHGPVMDVSGIDPRSGFSETNRESAERKVAETLLRSHELNPEGNITVNFHSAEGIPGSQWLPPSERTKETKYKRMIAVNRESGELIPIEHEILYYPGGEEVKPETITPEQRIDTHNRTKWDNQISQLIFSKERADEILEKQKPILEPIFEEMRTGRITKESLEHHPGYQQAKRQYEDAEAYLHDLNLQINSIFSKAYEFGTKEQKEKLREINNKFVETISKDTIIHPETKKPMPNPYVYAEAMHDLLHDLKSPSIAPQMYDKIENFATEQSAKTFGNAAWQSYKQFKDKTPILVIENPPAGFALSTGEDIKNIVEASRKQFVQNAVKEGMSEKEAGRQAEKFIGATWDVGHINMLRKYGYTPEEIVKEAEKVAPLVKHVHLSDNFGFEHTELPMGMGNVPLNEIMKNLGEKGFDAKKIIEAGAWWQHFRTPPLQESLEAMGSPIYGMKMAPYWNQAPGLYQGYFSGMEGNWLPQTNYETFGTTFSRLPKELGGQMPGAQGSRMSGRPME